MGSPPTEQCIVLPFRPAPPLPFDGSGLALHFLLGNVLILHSGLKEMWFGWRVKKIFSTREQFQNYCREAAVRLDLGRTSAEQNVRFWFTGSFTQQRVQLHFFDGQQPDAGHLPVDLPISIDDGLVTLRTRFIDWLASTGRAMPAEQVKPALWPEAVDPAGLDAVGRALEAFYIYSAYGSDHALDLSPFKAAVGLAPESFMAHDLYGWALYRNEDYRAARGAFLTSIRINPAGAGAMSGLMWCGVYAKDLEEAMYWSGRKADVCRQDVQAAREDGRRRYEKTHSAAGSQP